MSFMRKQNYAGKISLQIEITLVYFKALCGCGRVVVPCLSKPNIIWY